MNEALAIFILPIALMALGYIFRKAPLMLAATIAWVAFSLYIVSSTSTLDTNVKSVFSALGGVMALASTIQALYLTGLLNRRRPPPEDEAREHMEHVRRQVAMRRMSGGSNDELSDFDRLVKHSQVRLAKDRIKRKGYRISGGAK
jgi:Flp pilus assembly pilin Flp